MKLVITCIAFLCIGLTVAQSSIQVNGTISANLQNAYYRTQAGTGDAFQRSQLWHFHTNDADPSDSAASYTGKGPILRIGSLAADGDATTIIGEGAVFYGQNKFGNEMNSTDWAFGRVKPLRFQLRESIGGAQKDVFHVSNTKLSWRESGGASDNFLVNSDGITMTGKSGITFNTAAYTTQATSLTTGVIANSTVGRIVLFSIISSSSGSIFSVTNVHVASTSIIIGSLTDCVTSNGIACSLSFLDIVSGVGFDVAIYNSDAGAGTIAIPMVTFMILNPL